MHIKTISNLNLDRLEGSSISINDKGMGKICRHQRSPFLDTILLLLDSHGDTFFASRSSGTCCAESP